MKLRYTKQDGGAKEFELGERSITIGRSSEADIILLDEKVSRVHCGIRFWDGEFYVKDLKSKNGTFVNGHRVEVTKLKNGDTIRVGAYSFTFEQDASSMGTTTAIREIGGEMDLGKGYSTLLREIVDDSGEAPKTASAPKTSPAPEVTSESDSSSEGTAKPSIKIAPKPAGTRPPLKITIKRPPPKS